MRSTIPTPTMYYGPGRLNPYARGGTNPQFSVAECGIRFSTLRWGLPVTKSLARMLAKEGHRVPVPCFFIFVGFS
jgi:hypothetical protein